MINGSQAVPGGEEITQRRRDSMFNSEKLKVWQAAIDFADFVYSDTQASPNDERFRLATPQPSTLNPQPF
jgi:hypothetical protein